jgi:hypothetical protein
MRFFCLASLLASASAFTSQGGAFTTTTPVVGGAFNDVVAAPSSHANRRATIVMDGKANGTYCISLDRAYVTVGTPTILGDIGNGICRKSNTKH